MIKYVFIGSSDYGLPALQKLCALGMPPSLVISQPDKPAGRHLKEQLTPISLYALLHGLPLSKPADINSPDSLATIAEAAPQLIITASYGALLRKKLLSIAPLGAINLHPSLLPKYRGASPIQSAILAGETVTGTSIYRMIAAMDAGPVIAQKSLNIDPLDNYSTLHIKLADQAAEMAVDLLGSLKHKEEAGYSFPEKPQNQTDATWCPKIDSSLCKISWEAPAVAVHNKIRAFSFDPCAWVYFRHLKLKILNAEQTAFAASGETGTIAQVVKKKGFTVNCLDYQLLITTVQAAGKKIMSAAEFANGARISCGEKLWM